MRRPTSPLRFLAALQLALSGCAQSIEAQPQNVLIFLVDTLRADHLSSYGYERNTTPNLDAFAREGVLFERAWSAAPSTAPSHASLFTSTYPASHGVWNEVHIGEEKLLPRLSPTAVTMAEVFQEAGYNTGCIADGGWIIRHRGLDQGFDSFHSENLGVVNRVGNAIDWLDEVSRDQPFFLFLHTYEVHSPYLPPDGYEDRFSDGYQGRLRGLLAEAREYSRSPEIQNRLTDIQRKVFNPVLEELGPEDVDFMKALYDAELSLVDEQFALLMGYLRLNDLLDDTIVVVTSDHGEEFREHGGFGHKQVYEECLRVPLMIRVPGGPRGLRRPDPVQLVDLMPTLLDQLGLEGPDSMVGRALDLGLPEEPAAAPPFIAHHNHPYLQMAYRLGDRSVVFHLDPAKDPEFFLTADDRLQQQPRADTEGLLPGVRRWISDWQEEAEAHRLRFELAPVLDDMDVLSDDRRAELLELGYVDETED